MEPNKGGGRQLRLRLPEIYAGSVWPASIAHAVHDAAWGALAAFTLTSNPVMVNEYLAGDNGILILGLP